MLLGTSLELLLLFVGFGFVVGILFGFFGMGGSFLITPALLVIGYPARVAVGSGMAFVFGTAVIATLKHHNLGQVDYKLGGLMIAGTAIGIEVGRMSVFYLESIGLASGIISVAYVVLLGVIGGFVTRDALYRRDEVIDHGGQDTDSANYDIPWFAQKVQDLYLPPMIRFRGDISVSIWIVSLVAFITGVLSGFLGVGGGFIRMPAMVYGIGVPIPVAVGTDLFEIIFSGAIGSYLYAQGGGVDLGIVTPLLLGSALGARIGSAATEVVNADSIKIYFGAMLLAGSIAVAIGEIGSYIGSGLVETVSLGLIIGSAVLVSGAIGYSTIRALRVSERPTPSSSD